VTESKRRKCVDTAEWQRDKTHFPYAKTTRDERLQIYMVTSINNSYTFYQQSPQIKKKVHS